LNPSYAFQSGITEAVLSGNGADCEEDAGVAINLIYILFSIKPLAFEL
jgi:hypothetical protein